MNIKNALCFLVLGSLMHTTPALAQSLAETVFVADSSVRSMWLEFMGWVIGGIGFGYVAFEGAVRVSNVLAAVVPARLFRPVYSQSDAAQMQTTAVRVGVSY